MTLTNEAIGHRIMASETVSTGLDYTLSDPRDELAPPDRAAHDWVVHFASGVATPADLNAFRAWCECSAEHADAFARAAQLWETLGPAGQCAERRRSAAWGEPAGGEHAIGRRALLGGALTAFAATVGVLAVRPPLDLWPSVTELRADYRTGTAERRLVTIAPGVSVHLSARTSIAVNAGEVDEVVLIAGEAAVTVADRDRPLVLVAGGGRTVARDASFDVRHVGKAVCVTSLSGDLRIEHLRGATPLQPCQQVLYDAQGASTVRTIDPGVVAAWRDGFLVFHGTMLADAIEQVNRYRTGKIVLMNEALGRRMFNARFRIESVEDVVEQIRQVFDAKVTMLPGGIVLLS